MNKKIKGKRNKMPSQKDLSSPSDWDASYLITKAMEVASDNYFDYEEGYKIIAELVDRYSEISTRLKDLQKAIAEQIQ